MNEMLCPLCGSTYDELDHIPLMVPDCGHTFCKMCISLQIQQLQGQSFLCPEDNIEGYRTNITQFPVNFVLLKFFQKHRQQNIELQSQETFSQKSKQIRNEQDIKLIDQDDPTIIDEEPGDLCSEHFLKLDIVCLTDRARICTKCALFGQHKHHENEFKSVEDVVREVTVNAENIFRIYSQIQIKESDLNEQKCYELLHEKFKNVYIDSHNTVKEKFEELHQLLVLREQKVSDQINKTLNSLELQYRKQMSELIVQCSSFVELWKITAKDRLNYFSETTDLGQLPLDLYNSKFGSFEKGQDILEEMDKTINNLEAKIQNIDVKKLRIDFNQIDFDKNLDTTLTIHLQSDSQLKDARELTQSSNILNNCSNQYQMRKDQSQNLISGENISNILQSDIFSSYQEDQMLLRDTSIADWSEIQGDFNYATETQTIQKPLLHRQEQVTPQRVDQKKTNIKLVDRIMEKRSDNNLKSQFESSQSIKINQFQNSPANRVIKTQDENKLFLVATIRSGVSPTPRLPIDKKKKPFKIAEKFEQLWQALKADTSDTYDFSNAELQDEGMIMIANVVRQSKKLKTLKLVRNRITDEGACRLLDALAANQYQVFTSLHVQSNQISEKTLDHFFQLVKTGPNSGSLPKNCFMSLNTINNIKSKKKLDELRKLGFNIIV